MKLNNSGKENVTSYNVSCIRFIEAYIYLSVYRISMLLNSKNKFIGEVHIDGEESPDDVDLNTYRKARDVRMAIIKASKYTLFKSECLVQALAAKRMMNKRRAPITVYLGVKKDKNGKEITHAWTKCGFYYITGGMHRSEYSIVARFAASE